MKKFPSKSLLVFSFLSISLVSFSETFRASNSVNAFDSMPLLGSYNIDVKNMFASSYAFNILNLAPSQVTFTASIDSVSWAPASVTTGAIQTLQFPESKIFFRVYENANSFKSYTLLAEFRYKVYWKTATNKWEVIMY